MREGCVLMDRLYSSSTALDTLDFLSKAKHIEGELTATCLYSYQGPGAVVGRGALLMITIPSGRLIFMKHVSNRQTQVPSNLYPGFTGSLERRHCINFSVCFNKENPQHEQRAVHLL